MKLSDTLQAPALVVIQLLEQCNLRCRMCYEWGDTGAYHALEKPAMLELPLALAAITECLPTRPSFELFGGEPLLYPGIWQVIALIRSGGCPLAFPTNGTLLEEHAERLSAIAPTRLWVSLDGPEAVNDAQRGRGVFQRAQAGIAKVLALRRAHGNKYPEVGVTYVVTPSNWDWIEAFFLDAIDLSQLGGISIELQSWATAAEVRRYAADVREAFGVQATPCADAYLRDPADFAGIDVERVAQQLEKVRAACDARGVRFYSQPRTIASDNLGHYFRGNWPAMADHRTRCGVPWLAAEISARGDVSTCHTFNDLSLGNLHDERLLDIWRGPRAAQLRSYLRDRLFPICTACCRYWGGAGGMTTPRTPG